MGHLEYAGGFIRLGRQRKGGETRPRVFKGQTIPKGGESFRGDVPSVTVPAPKCLSGIPCSSQTFKADKNSSQVTNTATYNSIQGSSNPWQMTQIISLCGLGFKIM